MLRKASFEDSLKFHAKQTLKILSERFHDFEPEEISQDYLIKILKQYSFGGYPMVLYVACRLLRPEVVVETGAGAGLASTFILKALQENKRGFLYSIELPRSVYITEGGQVIDESYWVPHGRDPGWLVPQYLRSRWGLLLGKSQEILPHLLKECGLIDIFFHDSEHTYQNMMFEYQAVYPHMRSGGLLLSHDINLNNAFNSFAKSVNVAPIILRKGLGLIIKR